MLESIISPGTAERNPWDVAFLGFIVSSFAVWIGYYMTDFIPADPSMLALAITVMALAPLVYRILVIEEVKEECADHHSLHGFITRHMDVIGVYSFLFIGLVASFAFWYAVLPAEASGMPSSSEVFGLQSDAVQGVQHKISGAATSPVPEAVRQEHFTQLYNNNLQVMWLCFLASFLFGAGGLWLMAWNSSTIGVYIGVAIKENFVQGISLPFGISMWAIPEVLAYAVAAIAGGIISVAITRHHFKSEKFWLTVFDAMLFMLIALFLVFIGAYVEHFFVK